MRYRPIPSPQPAPEAELDTPEMTEAALAAERDEDDARVLAEVVEIGMRLMRAHEAWATARLESLAAQGAAPDPREDPTGAYNRIAQTVRRTIALKQQLRADTRTRRTGLLAERAARRARLDEDHAEAVRDVIDLALGEAHDADPCLADADPRADPDAPTPREIERREMLDDAEWLLQDLEAYGDWRSRPIGETVARLCVALGLAPDSCVKRGETWWVRRPDTAYETLREARRAENALPTPLQGAAAFTHLGGGGRNTSPVGEREEPGEAGRVRAGASADGAFSLE